MTAERARVNSMRWIFAIVVVAGLVAAFGIWTFGRGEGGDRELAVAYVDVIRNDYPELRSVELEHVEGTIWRARSHWADFGDAVDGNPDEQVVGDAASACEPRVLASRVEFGDLLVRHVLDPSRPNASRMLCESSFVIGTGAAIGPITWISAACLMPRRTR
jgi:hypothetical protein